MAAVTEKRGFHFPFGIRHLMTLPASSRSGYVTPVTLGAEEVSFGHHAPPPHLHRPPGQPGKKDSPRRPWPGASLGHLNCSCKLVPIPAHAYMTKPSYFRGKINSHVSIPIGTYFRLNRPIWPGQAIQANPNREGGVVQADEMPAGLLVISVLIFKVPQNAEASQR